MIEVRSISNVGTSLLKKMGITGAERNFLKRLDDLEQHAIALFDFLDTFEEEILGNTEGIKALLNISIGKWNE